MKEIKAFACDFCPKYYRVKGVAASHEKKCFRNPERRACITCKNFAVEKADHEVGMPSSRDCLVGIDISYEITTNSQGQESGGSLKADCPGWEQMEASK